MRYIPHTPKEIQSMLKSVGLKSIDDLFSSIPPSLRLDEELELPPPLDEEGLLHHLKDLSKENKTNEPNRSFLGGGAYRHYVPSAVHNLISRSEFVTPYTPYQPEIAQGTLQVLFEFQTMVAEIFGMEVANASLYDGSTSLVEAILMALRIGEKRKNILIPDSLHPEYREVVSGILKGFQNQLIPIPHAKNGGLEPAALSDYLNDDLAALVLPTPNFFGIVESLSEIVGKVHEAGGLAIFSVTEPLSLGIFESPGAYGADIVCGEGQSLGNSPSFGGPFVGLFASRQCHVRQMPGRLCGMTTDKNAKRGFVLTLSTREQHIRREKATSNICTNQALCATQMAIYLSLLGKEGFKKLAKVNWERSEYAKQELSKLNGVTFPFSESTTFNEFVIQLPIDAKTVLKKLKEKGLDGGIPLGKWYPKLNNSLLISVTEQNGRQDIDDLVSGFKEALLP